MIAYIVLGTVEGNIVVVYSATQQISKTRHIVRQTGMLVKNGSSTKL
jgi:hypothetical protein